MSYNGLDQPMKISRDAGVGGHTKKGGRHGLDAFTILITKVDALFQKVERLQPTPSYSGTLSGSF